MIRFHSDDSMGFKGFALSFVAVDPLEDDLDSSENIEEGEIDEVQPSGIPGYFVGGSLKYPKKGSDDDDYEEPEIYKKPDENANKEDLDEDLVTDNENNNYIYNSNRINKENSKILENHKKKVEIEEEDDEDNDD
jgi:hypothetical protein